MYQIERPEPTGVITLTATGSTPVELLQAALRGVLDVALGRAMPAADHYGQVATATGLSIPVRGVGTDVGQLFVDLSDDLLGQIEEYGNSLDDLRLDGLLRTDAGSYTAWGYLSDGPRSHGPSPLSLTVAMPAIAEADGGWRLVCELRPG